MGKPVAIQYMMILFPFILCRSYEALIGTVSHDTFDWLSDKQSRSEGVESGVGNRGSGTGGILTGPPGEVHIPIFNLLELSNPHFYISNYYGCFGIEQGLLTLHPLKS